MDFEDVKQAVEKEMDEPGSLLGYRALHKIICEMLEIKVQKNVYDVIADVNPQVFKTKVVWGSRNSQKRKKDLLPVLEACSKSFLRL